MLDGYTVAAVIVAAGASTRMGFDKLMHKIGGVTVLQHSVNAFANNALVDEIIIVTNEHNAEFATEISLKCNKPCTVASGGAQRVHSVLNGALAAKSDIIAIHDAARPFVSQNIIERTIKTAALTGACAPAVPVKDTVKIADSDGNVIDTPQRNTLFAVQTPQCFKRTKYIEIAQEALKCGEIKHSLISTDNCIGVNVQGVEFASLITDDCFLYEAANINVRLIEGEYSNIKITTLEDLPKEENGGVAMRIGHGYDVHKLVQGRKLILGGVEIEHETGLLGHSDADVLAHAVSDALLGACALGDIGKHFPDTKSEYKNADSIKLLKEVCALIKEKGYVVCNIDATVICQAPKLAPHINSMKNNIAAALSTSINNVSIKATTEEGLGFTGEKTGIAAHCVCIVSNEK